MDARKLLREQRSARQIKHPHAFYASSGLRCSVCRLPIKTESLWESHVRSAQHATNLKTLQATEKPSGSSRKRKASDSSDEGRKKVKSTLPEIPEDAELDVVVEDEREANEPYTGREEALRPVSKPIATDEDEAPDTTDWAEFEQDVAAMEAQDTAGQRGAADAARIHAQATISAPAMSAAELAAQAREEQSQQRGKRDDEIREEREEAQDVAAEELEKMEEFESRIQALRQRKQQLTESAAAIRAPQKAAFSEAVTDGAAEDDDADSNDDTDDFWTR